MEQSPLISIVIPTYNRGNIIGETIQSVLNQTYSNYEIIVVDDASTDNTEEVIKGIEDNRIKYIKINENSNGTKPRNIGINLSSGEYIALLDSDDEWLPEKLERQVDFITRSKMKNVLCFTGLIIKDDRSKTYFKNRDLKANEDIMDYILVGRNAVQTSTFMISTSLAKATLFNSKLKKHQDWDFCLRLRNNHANFLYLPEYLTIWVDDNRTERISNKYKKYYKDEAISRKWLEENRKFLSIKSQWAFQANVLVNYLIKKRRKYHAIKILLQAFWHQGISFRVLTKYLAKLLIPGKIYNEMKYLLKNFSLIRKYQ